MNILWITILKMIPKHNKRYRLIIIKMKLKMKIKTWTIIYKDKNKFNKIKNPIFNNITIIIKFKKLQKISIMVIIWAVISKIRVEIQLKNYKMVIIIEIKMRKINNTNNNYIIIQIISKIYNQVKILYHKWSPESIIIIIWKKA